MPSSKPDDANKVPKITDVQITDLSQIQAKVALNRIAMPMPEGKGTNIGGQNIVSMAVPEGQTIESFEPSKLKSIKSLRYSEVKQGAINYDVQKSSRFKLSELARGPLSVEVEEEERIEREIQARLKERFESIKDEVTKQAYEAGFSKGTEEAKKEFLTQMKPRIDQFEGLLQDLEISKTEIYKANEEFLIRLINRMAKAVILRELKEDTDYTKRLILQILDRLGTKDNIKIFVGEKAISSAEAIKEGLAQSLGQLKNVAIELDSSITHRGCRVETEFGEVDARIDVQIENLAKTLGVESSS
jgi:flagellar assembly protein FliH